MPDVWVDPQSQAQQARIVSALITAQQDPKQESWHGKGPQQIDDPDLNKGYWVDLAEIARICLRTLVK